LADSETAEVGDIIAAIGSPEGWHDTATVGRISNIHQTVQNADSPAWSDLIFIDADILQGISGGMVIGTDGLVYGLVIGVTGEHADLAIGENSVCPSNKIKSLLEKINV
jgi:S1-C subfamily serine protease